MSPAVVLPGRGPETGLSKARFGCGPEEATGFLPGSAGAEGPSSPGALSLDARGVAPRLSGAVSEDRGRA